MGTVGSPSLEPIVIFTRLRAQPGRRDDLIAIVAAVWEQARVESGTLVFAMHAASDDADALLFYEIYLDAEGLERHRNGVAVREAGPQLQDLLAEPPQITYATPLQTKGLPDG